MSKAQACFQAFGYHLDAIKPVHLANGYFLALIGKYYQLEWLNKLSVVSNKKGLTGEYHTQGLHEALTDKGLLNNSVEKEHLNLLRAQANAVMANDDAVYAVFDDFKRSAFGNDYTISSPEFLCDLKRKDGYAGWFIHSVFALTDEGRQINDLAKCRFAETGDSLTKLFNPVLDGEDVALDWEGSDVGGSLCFDTSRLHEVADLMRPQTAAILRLVETIGQVESRYAFLRQLVIALGAWLLKYLVESSTTIAGIGQNSLIFADFTGGHSPKCRSRSIHCFSRHRELVYKSFISLHESGVISTLEAYANDKTGRIDLDDVERHFQDLAVRIGFAQPRASTVRAKHYEPQPDTIRALIASVVSGTEGPVIFSEVATRLREVWGLSFGGCSDDGEHLAQDGIVGLDEDDDLRLNRTCFVSQIKSLGLAFEPSDGLILCEIIADPDR
jgi:hypothetical protein